MIVLELLRVTYLYSRYKCLLNALLGHSITDIIFVTGHFEDIIKHYVKANFPAITARFVRNNLYNKTNTGYSLMLTESYVHDDSFIKLDGDINFNPKILDLLLPTSDDADCICFDTTAVEDEVIKAEVDGNSNIVALVKYVETGKAVRESIGI
jgi:choline kinase